MNIKLSKRLQQIADMVKYDSLVDVGSDHALLPMYLLLEGRIGKALATDVARGPLGRGQAGAVRYGLESNIEFRLNDGLSGIDPFSFSTCVIAGMGGESIVRILENDLSIALSFSQLILSPQRDMELVRRFLCCSSFELVDEVMLLEDGKFYNILNCSYACEHAGDVGRNEAEYIFGRHLIERKCPVLARFIEAEIEKFTRFGRDEHLGYLHICREVLACIK